MHFTGESALPDMMRCAQAPACGYAQATLGPGRDDESVAWLRRSGWQVVDGAWTCPNHLPEDRKHVPGAMGRPLNPHCTVCGDTRGGAYGHEAFECTMRPDGVEGQEEPAVRPAERDVQPRSGLPGPAPPHRQALYGETSAPADPVQYDALGDPWTHRGDELAIKVRQIVDDVLERARTQAWPAEEVALRILRVLSGEDDPKRRP
jgi:hypothetical protein